MQKNVSTYSQLVLHATSRSGESTLSFVDLKYKLLA